MKKPKIFLALDTNKISETKRIIANAKSNKLDIGYKFGLEFFYAKGSREFISKIRGKKIFLDLKFHDIPNTMSAACYEVSKLGVDIISVHASAGSKALTEAKKASIEGAKTANVNAPYVIGITVLTSLSSKEFQTDLDRKNSIEENVIRLAKLSFDAGLDGCVCSPLEAKILRSMYKNNFELITPGIRTNIQKKDDQNRIMTPFEAISNGASKLVIGRAITKAKDPNKAFLDICESIC